MQPSMDLSFGLSIFVAAIIIGMWQLQHGSPISGIMLVLFGFGGLLAVARHMAVRR